MLKPEYADFLKQVYVEANTHLREQAIKRDQVVGFYLVLLSFYIGSYTHLMETLGSSMLQNATRFSMILISLLVIVVMIGIRSWHIQYTQCCETINLLLTTDIRIETHEHLNRFIQEELTKTRPIHLFRGIDNKIIYAMSIISFYNILIVFPQMTVYQQSDPYSRAFLLILTFSAYITGIAFYMRRKLQQANQYRTWILNFGQSSSQMLYSNDYLDVQVNGARISLQQKNGGVIIVPVTKDHRYLLLEIDRPVLGKISLEFPRGFREAGESAQLAAPRELREECNISNGTFTVLGNLNTDSGLIKDDIQLVMASDINIKQIELQHSEGIHSFRLMDMYELIVAIRKNAITDNFTLAAIAKLQAGEHERNVRKSR